MRPVNEQENYSKPLAKKIKEIRLTLGLNQEDFGKTFHPKASKGNVSEWEHGKCIPNSSRMIQLAALIGVNPEKLFPALCHQIQARDKVRLEKLHKELRKNEPR